MSSNVLGDDQYGNELQKGSFFKYQLKINHLNELNTKLHAENKQLRFQLQKKQQNINILLKDSCQNNIIKVLRDELQAISQNSQHQQAQNQKLLVTILLNQQTNIQSRKQSQLYISRYQRKIMQLRQSLQAKQVQIQSLQSRLQKYKQVILPMNAKNIQRYTTEIAKYQILLNQLIRQKQIGKGKQTMQAIILFKSIDNLKHGQGQEINPKINKPSKDYNNSANTDIRNHSNQLTKQRFQIRDKQLYDLMFLKLYLQTRELKSKLKQKTQIVNEYKAKDKVMKQGYNTITKQMQNVKVQNCQLKIQLQHIGKKLSLSSKQVVIKNTLSTKKTIPSSTSRISISTNLAQNHSSMLPKNHPSQTKNTLNDNKSNIFQQKIQNLEEILSFQNDNIQHDKKRIDNQQTSICDMNQEKNQTDLSISLNTSGFQMDGGHHQLSQHIISGLVDRVIF